MKNMIKLFKKIRPVDVVIVVMLMVALVIAGYVNLEQSKKTNDMRVAYVTYNDENRLWFLR